MKSKYARLLFCGIAICLLLGLFGCGNTKNKSAEEIAKDYLERTYKKEFAIAELTKKDAGPFKTREYSGFAYEKENPENRFKVWVDKGSGEVTDTYYCVTVLPAATEWIQREAQNIWSEAKVGLVFDVIRPNTDAAYEKNEYTKFLENESVDCEVYLFLSSWDELTLEKYEIFDKAISKLRNGCVHIFIVGSDELPTGNIADYYNQEPDINISIGVSESSMKEKLKQ